ncbi:hypothetical protein BGW41_001769 [Actinomortierella wolfii]|nr:hypothetical protein BGW41_001769 [Actinomortierella wolfii]
MQAGVQAAASAVATAAPTAATSNGTEEAIMSFQPSDFSFLNQVLHILEKVESGDDPHEIATLAGNLKSSFQKCQMILDHLPGADISPDEQERILEEKTAILARKKAQLQEYLSWSIFQHTLPTADPARATTTATPGAVIDTPEVKIEDESGPLHHSTMAMSTSSFEPPSLDYTNTTLSTDGMLSQMSEVIPATGDIKIEEKRTGLTQQTANVLLEDDNEIIHVV